jgi:hypothetical protein
MANAKHTPRAVSTLRLRDMKDASDIATRFWEPRRTWPADRAAESLLKEARRLHDQAMQCGRGEFAGLPHIWRFTASMLAVEATRLDAIAKATGETA